MSLADRSPETIRDFVLNDHNWFREKYYEKCAKSGTRYWTFKVALNLFLQRGGRLICETGCQRLPDDYGAGCSSQIFADFLTRYGGRLVSIDISAESAAVCEKILAQNGLNGVHQMIVEDSVKALSAQINSNAIVDLLLLDSWDYPYGELLNLYGGKEDLDAAIAKLKMVSTAEIIANHGDIIVASQEHCLNEIKAAEPLLGIDSIVLIDDSDLPGRGKGRLAIDYLLDKDWKVLLDDYATLLVRK